MMRESIRRGPVVCDSSYFCSTHEVSCKHFKPSSPFKCHKKYGTGRMKLSSKICHKKDTGKLVFINLTWYSCLRLIHLLLTQQLVLISSYIEWFCSRNQVLNFTLQTCIKQHELNIHSSQPHHVIFIKIKQGRKQKFKKS